MKIASWNVNSLRVRLPQVLDWLVSNPVDILCLQETKLVDQEFPVAAIEEAGYQAVYAGQKTYNGVATLSKQAAAEVVTELPEMDDPQRRVLGTTIGTLRVLNVYIPNGQSVGSEKYLYKMGWLHRLQDYVEQQLRRYPQFLLLGDFNIAPEDVDVHDPELWAGKVLCSDPERQAFHGLINMGLHDSFRKFPQPEKTFSWWDYRAAAFRRNLGLRIDHILCSTALYERCVISTIDQGPRKWERPSDHAPAVAEFRI
jgi:exodeoxyribonuclease-3